MPLHTIQVNLDSATFQTAVNRAAREGETLGQVVAKFLDEYAAGAGSGAPTTYTVKRGDSLSRIARAMYNDAHKYPLIQKANNITNPGRIWVGQVLIIPPLAGPAPQPPAPPPTPTPTPPSTSGVPAKPPVRWVGSPNFNRRPNPNDITALTIHATANSSLQGVISWFNNPNARVSAHYTIGKDGTIVQHVRDQDRAWHAGVSAWKGRSSCNDFCLGIELVNLNNGQDPYPEAQHQANVALSAYLCHTYDIATDDIMGHFDIALPPGRKTDPRGYDLNRLRQGVRAVLGR